MPCTGRLAVVRQMNNLSVFTIDDARFALVDGLTGFVLEKDGNEYKFMSTTVLDFTDQWHETATGVVGMTKDGRVKTWFREEEEEEEEELMPTGFQYVGDGHYLHSSLKILTTSPYEADLRAEYDEAEDMYDGKSLLVDWQSDRFRVMDATAPDRNFRVYQKTEDGEFVENETIKPMPEHTKEDPYSTYIQTVYHMPLFVVGKIYNIRENFALCVGATRTNPHCKEIYILQSNVWSRVSDWNEEGLERRFIPPNTLVSFRFQPRIGWAVTSVRHLRV